MTLQQFRDMVVKYCEEHPDRVELDVDDAGKGIFYNKSLPKHPNHPFECLSFDYQYWGTTGYKEKE